MTVLRGNVGKHFIQLCSSNFTEKRKIAYCIHAVREVDMSTASFLSYLVVEETNRKKKEYERVGKIWYKRHQTETRDSITFMLQCPVPTRRKPHREQSTLSIL